MTTPNSFDDSLRGKISVYATMYANAMKNLDASGMTAALDKLESLYLTRRNTELEKLMEHKEKMHPCSTAYECFEAVPVSAIQSLMKKGE